MQVQELIRQEDLLVGFQAGDKWAAIDRILDHVEEVGRLAGANAPEVREAVMARARSMSTGMEHGLAIPHAAVDGLDEVVTCLAVVGGEEGIAFESIDASPAHLIVLLLIPRSQKLLHIRTLANIARVLGREEVRSALRVAATAEEAWHALAENP